LLAVVAFLSANTASADVAVQYHCAGGSQLASNIQLATLQKVLALPATTNLENLARTRICNLLTNSLRFGTNSLPTALMEPLLSDVAENESLGSFAGASGHDLSFILALHLEVPRAQLWQDNLAKIFGGGGESFASQQFIGRRWKEGGSNSFWMIPAKEWLLVGRGDNLSTQQAEYLNQIKTQGRPAPALQHNWLEADIDSTRLGGWLRFLQPARIRITVAPKEDHLNINAQVIEADAIPWKSEPWQIPTNLMRGQIITFTAGQNVAAFLKMNSALSRLAANPLTNQFYYWTLDQMPMLNYMAWPVVNASNALASLSTEAPAALNADLKRFNGTELVWHPNRRLVWQNMGMLTPSLEAVQETNGQFLFLSSFPRMTQGKTVPDELLAQIQGRTNLVYYDWELTGRRLQEWQILKGMISNRALAQGNGTASVMYVETQWIIALAGLAGNTVTEITRVAPNELSIERKAPLVFTAAELVLLANWICDANSGPIHPPPATGNMAPLPSHP
jgi:hypothetical protein